ncbi:MAG: D-sedoheptulose 7-phosphate isomerase [Nanoarchaeota archaeon]
MIQRIEESINLKLELVNQAENIKKASDLIIAGFKKGNKVLVFGNGGSAADAQHIAAELVGRFKLERKGLPAIALTTDTSILTSISNDYSYDSVFERQVEALAKKSDVMIGISTSGNSKNVINAFKKGKEIGTTNISFTGRNGGELKKQSDININILSDSTARIQECHMVAYHIICEIVEESMAK